MKSACVGVLSITASVCCSLPEDKTEHSRTIQTVAHKTSEVFTSNVSVFLFYKTLQQCSKLLISRKYRPARYVTYRDIYEHKAPAPLSLYFL